MLGAGKSGTLVACDLCVGVVAVDAFKVFAVDAVPGDSVVGVECEGEVSDDVFDKLWVVVGCFGNVLFVGAFEDGVDLLACCGFCDLDEVFDPDGFFVAGLCVVCLFEADLCFDLAALVVCAVGADFFGAGAEACCGCFDAEDEVAGDFAGFVGFADGFDGDFVVHEADGSGDWRVFADEVGEVCLEVCFGCVEAFADGVCESEEVVCCDGGCAVLAAGCGVEDLHEAAHVGALLVVREGDVHVDSCDGCLVSAVALAEADGVCDVFDADFVDGCASGVASCLDVWDGHG